MLGSVTRRVLAVAGLVCMLTFTVSFVMSLVNGSLLGGALKYVALLSAGLGVPLWFVLYADNKRRAEEERRIVGELESSEDESSDEEDKD